MHTCNFDGRCQRAGLRDHADFGILARMTLWLGTLNALGTSSGPEHPCRGRGHRWLRDGPPSSGFLGALPCPGSGLPATGAFSYVPLLQVLHQVLVVPGLPRVSEEHDVWSEMQALQVMCGGWKGWEK